MARPDVNIISFDAYGFGDKVALYLEEIQAFLNSGGRLAVGIVPTADLEALHRESLESLK